MEWGEKSLEQCLSFYDSGVWGEPGILGDTPVLRSTNIRNWTLDTENELAYRKVSARDLNRCKLEYGDIIVTKSSGSPHLIGEAAFFDLRTGKTYLFSNFLLRLRPNIETIFPRYLFLFLRSPEARKIITEMSRTTSGLRNLQIEPYKNQKIPLPCPRKAEASLAIQRQIVARVEALLSEVREMQEINQKIIEDTNSLLKSSLINMFAQAVQKGWEKYALGDLVNNFDGKRVPLKKGDRLNIRGIYPYYGATGVIDHVNHYLFEGEFLLVSEDGANLIARKYPIAFIASSRFWVNNHAHVVQAKPLTTNHYLAYAIEGTNIRQLVTGAAQPKLNQAKLNQIPIWLPKSKVEQDSIVRYFDEIKSQSDEMRQYSEKNRELFYTAEQAILEQAFRGAI